MMMNNLLIFISILKLFIQITVADDKITNSAAASALCTWQKVRTGINAEGISFVSMKSVGYAINSDHCGTLCMMNLPMFKPQPCRAFAFSPEIQWAGPKHNCFMYSSNIDPLSFNTTGPFDLYKQNFAGNSTNEIKDENCCNVLPQNTTSNQNGSMLISYDSNICRKNANVRCPILNMQKEITAAIVINKINYSDLGISPLSFPVTCKNGKWQMVSPPLTIESLECQFKEPSKMPEQNITENIINNAKNESCCGDLLPYGKLSETSIWVPPGVTYDSYTCRKVAHILCSDMKNSYLSQYSYKLTLVDDKRNYINSENQNMSTTFSTFATCKNQKWEVNNQPLTVKFLDCRLMQIPNAEYSATMNSTDGWKDGSCCNPLFQNMSSNSSVVDGKMIFSYDSNICRKIATITCSNEDKNSYNSIVVNKIKYGYESYKETYASALCKNGKWQMLSPVLNIESLECQLIISIKQPEIIAGNSSNNLEDETCCYPLVQSANSNNSVVDGAMSFNYSYGTYDCIRKANITCSNVDMQTDGKTAIGVNQIQYDNLITDRKTLTVPAVCRKAKWQVAGTASTVDSLQCQFIPTTKPPAANNPSCCGPLVQSLQLSGSSSDGQMLFSYDSNSCRKIANITCADVPTAYKYKKVLIVNKIQYVQLGSKATCKYGKWEITDPLLTVESLECQFRSEETRGPWPNVVTDDSCCDPLNQNVSLNKLLTDGTMSFSYDSNSCRKKANLTCSSPNLGHNLQTNIFINKIYNVGISNGPFSMAAICNNGKWETIWEKRNIQSLECLLSYY